LKKKHEYIAQAQRELDEKEKQLVSLTAELDQLKSQKPAIEGTPTSCIEYKSSS
jgi:hypothetical protein